METINPTLSLIKGTGVCVLFSLDWKGKKQGYIRGQSLIGLRLTPKTIMDKLHDPAAQFTFFGIYQKCSMEYSQCFTNLKIRHPNRRFEKHAKMQIRVRDSDSFLSFSKIWIRDSRFGLGNFFFRFGFEILVTDFC